MTAEEHLNWALTRALDAGDPDTAAVSLFSDLNKYDGPAADLAAYDLRALLCAFPDGRAAVEQLMREMELVGSRTRE